MSIRTCFFVLSFLTATLGAGDARADCQTFLNEFFEYSRSHWTLTVGFSYVSNQANGDGPIGALGHGSFIWPRGQQNITVRGVFGDTEPDGSPTGKTPDLIRHVTKLLVVRELPLFANADAREDAQRRFRLTSERTRDQNLLVAIHTMRGELVQAIRTPPGLYATEVQPQSFGLGLSRNLLLVTFDEREIAVRGAA